MFSSSSPVEHDNSAFSNLTLIVNATRASDPGAGKTTLTRWMAPIPFGNLLDLPPDILFWGIALYAGGENTDITTRTITACPPEKLLAAQVPPTAPPISKLEYAILWTCLGILLSALVVIPVVLWHVKIPAGTTQIARRWTKVVAWVAWFNSLLCPLLTFVLVMIVDLETVVLEPIVIPSN